MYERQSSASNKETTSCIVSGDVVATLKLSYEVILTHNSPKLRLLTSINVAHTLRNIFKHSCEECRLQIFTSALNTGHISCGVCLLHPPFLLFVSMQGYQGGGSGVIE